MKILKLTLLLLTLLKINGQANPAAIDFANRADCVCTVTLIELNGHPAFHLDRIIVGELTKRNFEIIKKEGKFNRFKINDQLIYRFASRGMSYGSTIIEKNGDFTWDIGRKEQKFNIVELEKVFKDGRLFKE